MENVKILKLHINICYKIYILKTITDTCLENKVILLYSCDLICNKGPLLSNICDLICEKGSTVKMPQKKFCIHTVIMNSCEYIATVCTQNCFSRCANSGPFSQIRSQMF